MKALEPRSVLASAILSAACIRNLGTESASVGELARDCVVPRPPGVATWSPPVSVDFSTRALWVVDIVTLEHGTVVRSAAARVDGASAACAGEIDLLRGVDGRPLSVLRETDAEKAENALRTDGRRGRAKAVGRGRQGSRRTVLLEKIAPI
jgi:hypothetical protein